MRRGGSTAILAVLTAALALVQSDPAVATRLEGQTFAQAQPPAPALRTVKTAPVTPPAAASGTVTGSGEPERLKRLAAVSSWGYQLSGGNVAALAASPFDLIVIDVTAGMAGGKPLARADVDRLKKRPDGKRRIVVAYLSVGEVETARRDIIGKEFFEEDPPDWLLQESQDWKGHRLVNICAEGWQKTIVGDERGRSVYDSVNPAPLTRLVELGIDGVLLDRVDVYTEITKACADAETKITDFVARIAAAARRTDPGFLILQNGAEDLLKQPRHVKAVDGIVTEVLTPADAASTAAVDDVKATLSRLAAAKAQGRSVFSVDYATSKTTAEAALKRSRDSGFVPTLAPKDLGELWLPGRTF